MIQAALVYTNADEKRELRIFTKKYPISGNLIHLFNSTDCHVISSLLAKSAVEELTKYPLKTIQDKVLSRFEAMILAYKKLV